MKIDKGCVIMSTSRHYQSISAVRTQKIGESSCITDCQCSIVYVGQIQSVQECVHNKLISGVIFVDQKEIFIVYDNDEAGNNGASSIAKSLGEYRCRIFTFRGYPDKYDVGDWILDNKGTEANFGKLVDAEARRVFE